MIIILVTGDFFSEIFSIFGWGLKHLRSNVYKIWYIKKKLFIHYYLILKMTLSYIFYNKKAQINGLK